MGWGWLNTKQEHINMFFKADKSGVLKQVYEPKEHNLAGIHEVVCNEENLEDMLWQVTEYEREHAHRGDGIRITLDNELEDYVLVPYACYYDRSQKRVVSLNLAGSGTVMVSG